MNTDDGHAIVALFSRYTTAARSSIKQVLNFSRPTFVEILESDNLVGCESHYISIIHGVSSYFS
jgi:hypothetical protein